MSRLLVALSALCFLCYIVHGYIPVYVMLELDTLNNGNYINNPSQLKSQLQTLKSGGVDGVMTDTWWGIVENAGPKQYNWSGYIQLAEMVRSAGLTLQMVMSFHQCGANVGDQCFIPLPQWILDIGQSNSDIFYKDASYSADDEYLSLGVDNQPVLQGRTAIQAYTDFMTSLYQNLGQYMPNTINQIQVGLGPAGEMRYPSYQSNKWTYCGIGEFQCYDKYMLASLKAYAPQPSYASPPNNAGSYNSVPSQTQFFTSGQPNNYASGYGSFFINWYSKLLLNHGQAILSNARKIFPSSVSIAGKVSGIHWWYNTDSHAAEVTAGYYNTNFNNAYLEIAQMFASVGAMFDFTALEMVDSNNNCGSQPEQLVKQTIQASQQAGIYYGGENALDLCNPNCYQGGFDEVLTESTQYGNIHQFTYLRLKQGLLSGQNWNIFTQFVSQMHNA